jgi:hypothetical protein
MVGRSGGAGGGSMTWLRPSALRDRPKYLSSYSLQLMYACGLRIGRMCIAWSQVAA